MERAVIYILDREGGIVAWDTSNGGGDYSIEVATGTYKVLIKAQVCDESLSEQADVERGASVEINASLCECGRH